MTRYANGRGLTAYDCECGWSRTILDGETWDDARRIHTSLPIHKLAMEERAARKARGYVRPSYRVGDCDRTADSPPHIVGGKWCRHDLDPTTWGPSREGSTRCESGSIASGGTREFCSCDTCF